MTNNSIGHNDRKYRKLRLALRTQAQNEALVCVIPGPDCPTIFDWSIDDPNHPWSFTAHHVIPRSLGGQPDDPANLAPAHRRCNEHQSNRLMTTPTQDHHSETWP